VRPVNLIPPEDRRGDRAQSRTGVLPYVIVGALAAVLAGVALLVTTSNKISDREAELASLEAQRVEAQARADALAPYADLAALAVERSTTVTSLAQSRFDWDRVLRELALVIPDDVWLTELTGTVTPDVQLENGAEVQLRQSAPGPALSIIGCAASHESVAAFLQALRDVDGVTRVAIESDERPEQGSSGGGGGASGDSDCRTRQFISRFQVVAAFDAVTVPPAATAEPLPAAEVTAASGDGVSDARAEQDSARDSAADQTGEAGQAAEIVPGVAR
jgi:Tfp pilus assembly protein PilN